MSTTGHYTRYINQYNQIRGDKAWSDNCDTMLKYVVADCLKVKTYDYPVIGHFQIEHNTSNTWSWCDLNLNNRSRIKIYEYEGKKAIQNVLDYTEKLTYDQVLERILKYSFYNRSYMDYFNTYLSEVK